jgi:hypothetical protein
MTFLKFAERDIYLLAASQGCKYFNGDDFHEAYWRTLSTDRFYDLRKLAQYVKRLRYQNLAFWREGCRILESEVESTSSGTSRLLNFVEKLFLKGRFGVKCARKGLSRQALEID